MKHLNYQNKSIFLFFLLFVLAGFAQGPIKLGWNGSVGCQTFGLDPRVKDLALSDIQEDVCLNVCENTSTTFTLTGAGLGTSPTTTWSVMGGGYLQPKQSKLHCKLGISWSRQFELYNCNLYGSYHRENLVC